MRIIITHDLPILNQHLTVLYERLNGDLSPLMSAIATLLENSTRERFNTKIDPDGVAWASLLPSTVKRKGNDEILVDTGALADSILSDFTAYSATVGSSAEYSAYPQFGSPARAFLGVSQDDEQEIYDEIAKYLQGDW